MSFSKIITAIKGAINGKVEDIADDNALLILDQEMREANEELQRSDRSLTKILGKQKLAAKKVEAVSAEVEKFTSSAIKASEQGEEALAIECAERVAELETELADEKAILDGYEKSVKTLRDNIKKAKQNVKRMTIQIENVKATDQVQKAQMAANTSHVGANSKVKTAVDSLDRLKRRQDERAAELEAAQELADDDDGSSLTAKLKASGVEPGGAVSGSDKLAQLLKNKSSDS